MDERGNMDAPDHRAPLNRPPQRGKVYGPRAPYTPPSAGQGAQARRILTGEMASEGAAADAPDAPASPTRAPLSARALMLWAAALACFALLVFSSAERWSLWQEQQAVAQTQAENLRIQLDIDQTRGAVAQAERPETIERMARRLGYIRPGDTPVIIAVARP